MIDAGAEAGDHLETIRRTLDQCARDGIIDARHEHVTLRHGGGERRFIHRAVVGAEARIEQFCHPRLYSGGEAPGDDYMGLGGARFPGHEDGAIAARAAGQELIPSFMHAMVAASDALCLLWRAGARKEQG